MAFRTRLTGLLVTGPVTGLAAAVLAALSLGGCGGEAPAPLEEEAAAPSAEAATVNGQTIYVSDVEMEARLKGVIRPGEKLEVDSAEFNEILDKLIDWKLLAMEAIGKGLDEEPEARHRLATARDDVLGNVLLEHIAEEKVDEAAILKMYETQVELMKPQLDDEAHVRHILAPTKEAIDKIAAELKAGAEFTVLAARRSADEATRMDGGDLGYMKADEATPEFAKVIRQTASGGVSKPFEDQMGWHIVKIDDVRKEQPPSIEELREPIVQFLRRTQLQEVLKDLRGKAEILKKTSPRNSRLDEPQESVRASPTPPAVITPAPAPAPAQPAPVQPAPTTPAPAQPAPNP
jgi:peptidyl-prolyl cis-trans isomerase C